MPLPASPQPRIRTPAIIAGVVLFAVIAGLLVVASLADRSVEQASRMWHSYMEEVETKAVLLTRLRGADGFAGLDADIRRLIRSADPDLPEELREQVASVEGMLVSYRALPLTEGERFGMRALETSLADFRDKLGVATHMIARGVATEDIQDIVPLEHANAVMALDLLEEAWTQAGKAKRDQLTAVLERLRGLTRSTLLAVPVLLLVALLVGWLSWRMVRLSDEAARERAGARETAALYRDLVEGSLQGMVIHDAFRPLFVNPMFVRMFGFGDTAEALALPSVLDLVDETYQETMQTVHNSIQARDMDTWTGRIRCLTRNGDLIWVEELARPIIWQGRPAVQLTLIDISEQVRHEEDMEMERGVTERQAQEVVALAEELDAALNLAEEQKAQLHRLSIGDALTGAFNRRHFIDCAREELARMGRQPGRVLSVMMLDIDHFKRVNDTYGHAAGDEALRVFTRACQGLLRETDIFGRLGGEEFAALLPGTDLDQARVVADRMLEAIRALVVTVEDQPPFGFTVSLGMTEITDPSETIEKALSRADEALYRSKSEGRDRLTIEPVPPPSGARCAQA